MATTSRRTSAKSSSASRSKARRTATLKRRTAAAKTTTATGRHRSTPALVKSLKRPRIASMKSAAGRATSVKRCAVEAAETRRGSSPSRQSRVRSRSSLNLPPKSLKRSILERLQEGPVIGDGGFVFALEKRGYLKAGPWTPEVTVEHPQAVRELHREFLRAGADVMQALSFYASDDKLENRGNSARIMYTGQAINEAACSIAKEVASEGDALVAGGICQTPSYLSGKGKTAVQQEFRKQVQVFVENDLDFIICEYFEHVEEMEWAIEVATGTCLPVAATMCIGPDGDMHGVTAGDCAVRMATAGAQIVGTNCHFDADTALKTLKLMKEALERQGFNNTYLMTQPLAYWTSDCDKRGFIALPEFPFALEPRLYTRWDAHKYARHAYELGVRYIGGCCGFEPYHIRAVAEELAPERGDVPPASDKHAPWGAGLDMHTKPCVRARAYRQHWEDLEPASGRPYSAPFSRPDNWNVTVEDDQLN